MNQSKDNLFANQPKYRLDQFYRALFDPQIKAWDEITTLPQALRNQLNESKPFYAFEAKKILEAEDNSSYKAVFETRDELLFESVLMKNTRGQYTICLSSQIGCKMGCTFCATGQMGFKRNLTVEEIIDQVRFWQRYGDKEIEDFRISNLVFMGMGEPLDNYDNVVKAIDLILEYTDIGKTKIIVSTVGLIGKLEKILTDPAWPQVRIALSLQTTDYATRKELIPATEKDFFDKFKSWSQRYLKKYGNRNNYLTFEYVMMKGKNDSLKDAEGLSQYAHECQVDKINLIPYNSIGSDVSRSDSKKIEEFKERLEEKDLTVTIRKSLGQEIKGACGQLVGN